MISFPEVLDLMIGALMTGYVMGSGASQVGRRLGRWIKERMEGE